MGQNSGQRQKKRAPVCQKKKSTLDKKSEIITDGIFAPVVTSQGKTRPPPPIIRILRELFYMPKNDSITNDGKLHGYSMTRIKTKIRTNKATVEANLGRLKATGMIIDTGTGGARARYVLSTAAVTALRQLTTFAPAEYGGSERGNNPRAASIQKKEKEDRSERRDEVKILFQPHEIRDLASAGIEKIYVVRIPSSAFFSGEYSVVMGARAVLFTPPLYLHAAMFVETASHASGQEVYVRGKTGGAGMSFSELKQHEFGDWTTDSPYSNANSVIRNDFMEKLSGELPKDCIVNLLLLNEIPISCGIGSSGAFSAALSLLLNIYLKKTIVDDISIWSQYPERLKENSIFNKVFNDAYLFERKISKRSSGAGPFASLIGSVDGTPFLYQRNDPISGEDIRVQTYEKVEGKDSEFWKDFGIALMYTRIPRYETGDIMTGAIEQRFNSPDLTWKDRMEGVTQTLWKNVNERDWNDVVASMCLYAQYEAGYFKTMLPSGHLRLDDPQLNVRKMCGFFHGLGLGAKYTGSGNGGDLIVGGNPTQLKESYFKNHFPLHFSTDNLPEGEFTASPSATIIETKEWLNSLKD